MYRGTPTSLETRFTAASVFLALPGMFNRYARGAKLLDEVLADPLLTAAPLAFRGAVWLRAGGEAIADKRPEDARRWLQRGEMLALTGPSGSGKSTLLNLAGLIDRPDARMRPCRRRGLPHREPRRAPGAALRPCHRIARPLQRRRAKGNARPPEASLSPSGGRRRISSPWGRSTEGCSVMKLRWLQFAWLDTLRNHRRSAVTVAIAAQGTAVIWLGGGFALFTYEGLAQIDALAHV